MKITILGLSITSSWGNGHATTFRSLVSALHDCGHQVLFLERDVPWYATNRDLPEPEYCSTRLYGSLEELRDRYACDIRQSDVVIVGSYVPDGVAVGQFVTAEASGITAFYDIDTPVTLAKLGRGDHEYLTPTLVGQYDLYLSFTGGPTLDRLQREFGSPMARPLYCSVDPDQYYPETTELSYDLGYLGTYSIDRQPTLQHLLVEPAKQWSSGRFVVAGPQYPAEIQWPDNVRRIDHVPPARHRQFYNAQRFTLNVTRADMVRAGFSPSVRLFEAAACGVPVISDWWPGLDQLLVPGEEILIAQDGQQSLRFLRDCSEADRQRIGQRGRQRVLEQHTKQHRAVELQRYVDEVAARKMHPAKVG